VRDREASDLIAAVIVKRLCYAGIQVPSRLRRKWSYHLR